HSVRLIEILFCLVMSVNWPYAFSSTYLNTPVDQFKEYLNESLGGDMSEGTYDLWWDLIQNIWFVGFFVGIFLNTAINDRLGKNNSKNAQNLFHFSSQQCACRRGYSSSRLSVGGQDNRESQRRHTAFRLPRSLFVIQ
ncbi:hypothetical protein PENTCL1PPCAC_3855, partial [Pristionchus entomophagus]